MTIRIRCPRCQHIASLHESLGGTMQRCPQCQHKINIPVRKKLPESNAAPKASPAKAAGIPAASAATKPAAVASHPPAHEEKPHRKKKKKQRGGGGHQNNHHEEAFDITPMVDVAFLLLIFFMVTSAASVQKVIRTVPEPKEGASSKTVQAKQEEEVETVLIQIDEANCYAVIPPDGDRIDTPSRLELTRALKNLRQPSEDVQQKIMIEAHEDSNHGAIVGAMDSARIAEFTKLDFKVVEEMP